MGYVTEERTLTKMDHSSTGYGPPARGLYFDGDSNKWEEWEVKFLAYMNLKKLKKVVMPNDTRKVGGSIL